jgi:hypothetical protein
MFGPGGKFTVSAPEFCANADYPLLHIEGMRSRTGFDQDDRTDVAGRIGGLHCESAGAITDVRRCAGNHWPCCRSIARIKQVGWGINLYMLLISAALRVRSCHSDRSVRKQQRYRMIQARISSGTR